MTLGIKVQSHIANYFCEFQSIQSTNYTVNLPWEVQAGGNEKL